MTKDIEIFSIDIETSGCNLISNGIISIGYCLGDVSGNVVEKERISFCLENMVFEQRCYDEFWSKNYDILHVLQLEAKPILQQIKKFADKLDEFDSKYDLRIISDNKDFDLAFINYYFAKYLDRKPINYKFGSNEYRPTYDTDSYSRGVMQMNYDNIWTSDKTLMEKFNFNIECIHSHYPDDDAEYIYKYHTSLINKLV